MTKNLFHRRVEHKSRLLSISQGILRSRFFVLHFQWCAPWEHKEPAIRTAPGDGGLRLLGKRLTESFLFAAIGVAGGIALAAGAVAWFVHVRRDMTRVTLIRIDGMTVAMVLARLGFRTRGARSRATHAAPYFPCIGREND